jgi:hypothetical protein
MTELSAELFDQLEGYYRDVIIQMEDKFTSHEFIEKLSQAQQELYGQLLSEYTANGQPFRSVHSVIARRLSMNWGHLVHYMGTEPNSENVFGNYNGAAIWHKVR